MDGGNVLTIRV